MAGLHFKPKQRVQWLVGIHWDLLVMLFLWLCGSSFFLRQISLGDLSGNGIKKPMWLATKNNQMLGTLDRYGNVRTYEGPPEGAFANRDISISNFSIRECSSRTCSAD